MHKELVLKIGVFILKSRDNIQSVMKTKLQEKIPK